MRKILHAIKIFLGFIAAWQLIGILPVLTWLTKLGEVTESMWATVLIKVIVLIISGGIYYWIDRKESKDQDSGVGNKELRYIGRLLLFVFVVGVVLAVVVPIFGGGTSSKISQPSQEKPLAEQKEKPSGKIEKFLAEPNEKPSSEIEKFLADAPEYEPSATVSKSKTNLESQGWTQESTNSTEAGPWLQYSPQGTRYCRLADRTIVRLYPPYTMPNAEKANPFCLDSSSESVPP